MTSTAAQCAQIIAFIDVCVADLGAGDATLSTSPSRLEMLEQLGLAMPPPAARSITATEASGALRNGGMTTPVPGFRTERGVGSVVAAMA
jgi:hypothetical protein